jgi:hypothetical protein
MESAIMEGRTNRKYRRGWSRVIRRRRRREIMRIERRRNRTRRREVIMRERTRINSPHFVVLLNSEIPVQVSSIRAQTAGQILRC